MFIMHFGRHNNGIEKIIIYQLSYQILDVIMKIWPFITPIMIIIFLACCPNSNTLKCKLDTVNRYTMFNGIKLFMDIFTHILHKTKCYSNSFCYMFYNIIENHP